VREGLSRPLWLALVIAAFCVPLFVGLGRTDLENDEGIYSFAVDGLVNDGDWLNPKSSPNDDVVFVEKPPLKFWIVALPIRLGLLPHNEFGLRFWDVLFSAIGFLYVFFVGCRLAGPVCGFVAVMVLVAYEPLSFLHGLRNNNMEAPLFLCYCGGVYHYLRWAEVEKRSSRRNHVAAIWVYFFLGFMTKFAVALFLPMMFGAAALLDRPSLVKLWQDRRLWLGGFVIFVLVSAPWFIYQSFRSGWAFWQVIFAYHVYLRFTGYLDASHVRPWNFYLTTLLQELSHNGTLWLTIAGSILLVFHTVRERRLDRLLVILWFVVPVFAISSSTSKLHHYLYPFLPPIGLAAGYAPAWLLGAGRPYFDAVMERVHNRVGAPSWGAGVRTTLLVIAGVAVLLSIGTLLFGQVQWRVGDTLLFRNSHVGRPLVIAFVLATVAGRAVLAGRWLLPIALLMSVLPITGYENVVSRAFEERHPLRTARDCLREVRIAELTAGRRAPGMYAIAEYEWFLHSYYYYLRHVGGWERTPEVDKAALEAALFTPGRQRPIILPDRVYLAARSEHPDEVRAIPRMVLGANALLMMPGPYASCAPKLGAVPQ
jgi:hypothetical protein